MAPPSLLKLCVEENNTQNKISPLQLLLLNGCGVPWIPRQNVGAQLSGLVRYQQYGAFDDLSEVEQKHLRVLLKISTPWLFRSLLRG